MTGAESDAGLPPGMTPASWAWKEVQFSLYVCRRVSVSPASPVSRARPCCQKHCGHKHRGQKHYGQKHRGPLATVRQRKGWRR